MSDVSTIATVCILAFVAGFIDSVAGGGGMIQLPGLLFLGLPPAVALGTNKIASFFGTLMATIRFSLSTVMPWKLILCALPIAAICSIVGARLILVTDSELARKIIVVVLPIIFILSIVLARRKNVPRKGAEVKGFIGTTGFCGLYDGYLGPGTGTFLAASYNRWSGMNYVLATACAKPVNLITNLGALVIFVSAGQYRLDLALPMIAFNVLGAFLGSSGALKFGESFVKKMLITSFALLGGINLWKGFFG